MFIIEKTFKLLEESGFTLPCVVRHKLWERIIGYFSLECDRICHLGLFESKKGQKFKIANLHLDSMGKSKIRRKQLKFVLKTLANFPKTDLELIIGDFNTVGILKKEFPELEILKNKKFTELTEEINWTASPSNPDPNWKATHPFFLLVKPFHPLLRQKMDYVFGKGKIKNPRCQVIDIASSDHRALVLEF